ncbi:hypothetical protein SAMN05216243_2033 [Sediminibacillus albus]|uniref:Uncharacterized protein n=1 Tax=Sediminibacillus albus TaxID=407036 RepID=A0A1G8ZI34_9BACI|nr:hypothetical protein SAMN05216243_2033 [Sediminibacillus albus]
MIASHLQLWQTHNIISPGNFSRAFFMGENQDLRRRVLITTDTFDLKRKASCRTSEKYVIKCQKVSNECS